MRSRQIQLARVRYIELCLSQIRRSIAMVVLIEREQVVFAVTFDVADEPYQTRDHLIVGATFICNAPRAEVDLEFRAMKRMPPTPHLWIDECPVRAGAQTRHVRVIVNQERGINAVEGALDKIGGFRAETSDLFGLMFEA